VVPAAATVEASYPALSEAQAASTAALVAALEGARDLAALAVRWRALGAAHALQAGCEARGAWVGAVKWQPHVSSLHLHPAPPPCTSSLHLSVVDCCRHPMGRRSV
jgi:hypothetical protein